MKKEIECYLNLLQKFVKPFNNPNIVLFLSMTKVSVFIIENNFL